jgi:TolA-binding protein
MEAARATWTDSRLDDLSERVKVMDTKMDEGFTRLDAKMDAGFTRLDERIDGTNGRIDAMSDRIDKLQHAIIMVGGSLFAVFIAFLAAILGLIITLIVLHS